MTTTAAASSMTTLRTTGRSRLAIAWNTSRPRPGSENTCSMTTVPASRLANCRPITVTTGTIALRSTWPQSTPRRPDPGAVLGAPAGKAAGREPEQLHREREDQQDREPEVRDGDADLA